MDAGGIGGFAAGGGPLTLTALSGIERLTLQLTVETARIDMRLADVLALGEGSSIDLRRMRGDPFELRANGVVVATGDLVSVDGRVSFRVTGLPPR
jgi:flagellar motor switch protein FliN/FliY